MRGRTVGFRFGFIFVVFAALGIAAASGCGSGRSAPTDGAVGEVACVPTVPPIEVCDGVDNDCNGLVDDVDVAGDGIYDCQHIALFGAPGTNPSSDFVAWLQSNGSIAERVEDDTTASPPPLTAALLGRYNVIILDRLLRTYTADEAALLVAWVEGGGGLMSMSGYTGAQSDLDDPNSLLANLGLAYVTGLLSGPVTTFEPHPLTAGITSMTFSGGFRVGPVAGITGGTNATVASLPAGPVGIAQTRAAGRAFVWGDEWITFDSEWASMPQVKTFWINILAWLGKFR